LTLQKHSIIKYPIYLPTYQYNYFNTYFKTISYIITIILYNYIVSDRFVYPVCRLLQSCQTLLCPGSSSTPEKRTPLSWRVPCKHTLRWKSRGKRKCWPRMDRHRRHPWSPKAPTAGTIRPGNQPKTLFRAQGTQPRCRQDPLSCSEWNRCKDRRTLVGTVVGPRTGWASLIRIT